MSTQQPSTAQTIQTIPTTTTEDAPFTFDPFNTNPTPQMFADKWQATEE